MHNDDNVKGHSHDEDIDDEFYDEDEEIILTLTDEEGQEIDFWLLGEFELKGNLYRVVTAVETSDEDDEEELIILKVIRGENDEEFMVDIEDDEEWEMAADAWQELYDSEFE